MPCYPELDSWWHFQALGIHTTIVDARKVATIAACRLQRLLWRILHSIAHTSNRFALIRSYSSTNLAVG